VVFFGAGVDLAGAAPAGDCGCAATEMPAADSVKQQRRVNMRDFMAEIVTLFSVGSAKYWPARTEEKKFLLEVPI
jgi:hypothetical protein